MAETILRTQQAIGGDGWSPAKESWTYASASTITVPTGAASKYAVGDRIKWTQTTVKYGVIVVVADTLLTIAVNTDYVVANAAITLNYYSHQDSPVGYPHYFNYTPTFSGWSSAPTINWAYYRIDGRTCTFSIDIAAQTSNSVTHNFTVPVVVLNYPFGVMVATDNSAAITAPAKWAATNGSATIPLFRNFANDTWTASGTSLFDINHGQVKF